MSPLLSGLTPCWVWPSFQRSVSMLRWVRSIAMYQNSPAEHPCSPSSMFSTAGRLERQLSSCHPLHNSILFSPLEQTCNSVSAFNACSSVARAHQKFSRMFVPQLEHEPDCPAASAFYSPKPYLGCNLDYNWIDQNNQKSFLPVKLEQCILLCQEKEILFAWKWISS